MKTKYTLPGSEARIELSRVSRFNHAHITQVIVPISRRGEGVGSKLLREVCEDADREGILLTLSAIASIAVNQGKVKGLAQADLMAWYRRYGFIDDALCDMRRVPAPGDAERISSDQV